MSPRSAAPVEEERRPSVLGALAAALPERVGGRRPTDQGPGLKVVEPTRRRRRNWQVGTVAGLVLFVALFLIAGAQTLIVQQQGHLDGLNDKIDTAEQESERLRVEVAELQSPERIESEAETRLGMVRASTPVYLLPRIDDDARAADVPPTTVARPTPTTTVPTKASKDSKAAVKSTTPTTAASAKTTTTTATKATTTKSGTSGATTSGSASAATGAGSSR
jgi:cell division protein FtsL